MSNKPSRHKTALRKSKASSNLQLTQVITQANTEVELEFRAMERSLRATGCDLPLRVIPFDERRFELPDNAEWLEWGAELSELNDLATHPCQKRYGVLTLSNYQYADADIIFLQDPAAVLEPFSGFVATCTQWRMPQYAVSAHTQKHFEQRSATWRLKVFNSGQFVCERGLYSAAELVTELKHLEHRPTCFPSSAPWDQPGFNLLVTQKIESFTSLTLPPTSMESTMAVDYAGQYHQIWESAETPPYLIHWAGPALDHDRPINELFFEYLTKDELASWKKKQRLRLAEKRRRYRNSLPLLRRLIHDAKQAVKPVRDWSGALLRGGDSSREARSKTE